MVCGNSWLWSMCGHLCLKLQLRVTNGGGSSIGG